MIRFFSRQWGTSGEVIVLSLAAFTAGRFVLITGQRSGCPEDILDGASSAARASPDRP
jgi:hypothetical protein